MVGTPTTINSGDMAGILMIAVQALEKRTAELRAKQVQFEALEKQTAELKEKVARLEGLEKRTAELTEKEGQIELLESRLGAIERKLNFAVQVRTNKPLNDDLAGITP